MVVFFLYQLLIKRPKRLIKNQYYYTRFGGGNKKCLFAKKPQTGIYNLRNL